MALTSSPLRGRADLRVGGGYSPHGNTWTGSPPRRHGRKPAAPAHPVTRTIKEFPAKGVVAVEVLQGGATIWTAEQDGSINVRNGFTGEVATAERAEDGKPVVTLKPQGVARVVRLHATEHHMWVGLDDGNVRIYDHLVIVQVWPETASKGEDREQEQPPHRASVKYFCPMYDGTMVSGDIEGNLVKWSGEEPAYAEGEEAQNKSFEILEPFNKMANGKTRPSDHHETAIRSHGDTPHMSLNAMDSSGDRVYSGDSLGSIYVLDEKLELQHTWDAGHVSVTTVKFMDGLLFTGGTDSSVRIWQSPQPGQQGPEEPLKTITLESPLKRVVGDQRAHQIWAIDQEGAVTKFESTAPFSLREDEKLNIGKWTDLASFTTWDAVRVWSTGSNGANFSWFAQWSRAEEQMEMAIENMQSIITEDKQELERWQDLIDGLEKIDEDRKRKLVRALEANSTHGLMHIYFRQWHLWLRRMFEFKRRKNIAGVMMRNSAKGLTHIYWTKLLLYYQHHKNMRQKRAMCENIMACTEKGLRRLYWKKIDDYRHKKKKEAMKLKLGDALLANTETGVCRKYFRKTMRYLDRQRIASKRANYSSVLMRSTESGLRRVYYYKLERYRVLAAKRRRREAIGQAMMSNTKRGLQRQYYRKFCTWGESLKWKRQKGELSAALQRATTRGLLACYQQKIDIWLEHDRKKKLEDELARKRARLAELKRKEQEQAERMRKKRELDELQAKRDELDRQRAELQEELEKLRREHEELQLARQNKEKHEADIKKKAMSLDDAMAKLKEMALNFDSDFDAIQKNTDRCASTSAVAAKSEGAAKPVISQFLAAHMVVKQQLIPHNKKYGSVIFDERVWWPTRETLISDCKDKKAGGDDSWRADIEQEEKDGEIMGPPWNLDGKFEKIENFQYNVIFNSIKTMVILFDMMTKADKDMIKTDGDLIINASNIMHLYENSARVKERRKKKEWHDSTYESLAADWKQIWAEYKGCKDFEEWDKQPPGK